MVESEWIVRQGLAVQMAFELKLEWMKAELALGTSAVRLGQTEGTSSAKFQGQRWETKQGCPEQTSFEKWF